MPRPRTPTEKADITGQSTKNKKRYSSRKSAPKVPGLGGAFEWMEKDQKAAFEQIRKAIPWLKESDRVLVEITATLYARLMKDPAEMPVAGMNQLRMCLSSMGATPADISKVSHDEEEDDPSGRFFNQ